MSLPRNIDSFGGVFDNAEEVTDPTTEQSAAFANQANSDLAEMTRTTVKAIVTFTTTTTAAPTTVTPSAGRSHMGTGSAQFPTVSKTGTGLYTITYPASWTNAIGVLENISFVFPMAQVWGPGVVGAARMATLAANVATVQVRDGSGTLSDLSGTANVTLFLW